MRLWLNTGSADTPLLALANKGNIGLQPEEFDTQTYATDVKNSFSPSAEIFSCMVEI